MLCKCISNRADIKRNLVFPSDGCRSNGQHRDFRFNHCNVVQALFQYEAIQAKK